MYAHMLLAVLATSQLPGAYAHPLIEGGRVTFLAEARNGVTPVLLGDFNWWGRYPSAEGIAGGEMELVHGTKWHSASIELTYAARLEYGFAYGNDVVPDPHNPETIRTFGMLRSVVEMPGYEPSRFVTASETPANVRARLSPAGRPGRRPLQNRLFQRRHVLHRKPRTRPPSSRT